MNIRFETCDRKNALIFLKKFYPSYKIEDTDDSAKKVLDFVEKDIIRIPDPSFHPGGGIFPSKNYDTSMRTSILDAFAKITNVKNKRSKHW